MAFSGRIRCVLCVKLQQLWFCTVCDVARIFFVASLLVKSTFSNGRSNLKLENARASVRKYMHLRMTRIWQSNLRLKQHHRLFKWFNIRWMCGSFIEELLMRPVLIALLQWYLSIGQYRFRTFELLCLWYCILGCWTTGWKSVSGTCTYSLEVFTRPRRWSHIGSKSCNIPVMSWSSSLCGLARLACLLKLLWKDSEATTLNCFGRVTRVFILHLWTIQRAGEQSWFRLQVCAML